MFERFTDRARRVVVMAQEEARMLDHNYIGTEHILLGLIHEGKGAAAKALESMGISLEAVRQQVEEIIGRGKHTPSGHIPFTPRAKKVLELSLRESLQLGHNYIGTEHILLGLIREGEGVAAQVLVRLGADLNRVRNQVIVVLHGREGQEVRERPASAGPTPSPIRFRAPEIMRLLSDITARLDAIEEHLGIRRSAESGQAGAGAEAKPGEVRSGEAKRREASAGEAAPDEAVAGEAGSGKAAPDQAASGQTGPDEAGPGGLESGEASPGEAGPGEVPGEAES
jgi:hypothetical protein